MDFKKIKIEIETAIKMYKNYEECLKKNSNKDISNLSDFKDDCTDTQDEVIQYFESLSQEDVTAILAIMYAGRDYVKIPPEGDSYIPFEMHYKKYRNTDKNVAISQIMDKSDLIEYLSLGMKYYENEFYS